MRLKGKKPIFSVKDTWSLDTVFNNIIAAGLKKFKEVVVDDDNCAGFPSCVEGDIEEESLENWYSIIDKMIFAFEYNEPEIPHVFEFVENGDGTYIVNITDEALYAQYKKDEEEFHAKVKEGRELFVEYYENLGW